MTKQPRGRAFCAWTALSAIPLVLTVAVPAIGAETGEAIEEIIVTGTLIQRNKFDMASPVEVIDAGEVLESGYTSIGPYIRDLTYTENVDTVANVLDITDGIQDSNSARFNLRGLGTSSTLTLFDGRRVLNSGAVAGILPDIALQRVEVILDGGAATYGTDAVAGVVNFIPMKDFDGWKVRGFYSGDTEGDTYEPKIAGLWGHDFGRFHIVAAAEYSERPRALYRSDRPKLLRADNDTSITGNPGSFNGDFSPISAFDYRIDDECGTYNGDNTDDSLRGSFPSGEPAISLGTRFAVCSWEYGEFQDYLRPNTDFVGYLGSTFQLTERMGLEFLVNYNLRESKLKSSTSTGERGSNELMPIPVDHPANNFVHWFTQQPIGVTPRYWRPFGKTGATLPSHLDKRGATTSVFEYETIAAHLGLDFEFGGSGWIGQVWGTLQQATTNISGRQLRRSRLADALIGMGGPNGNQWFNPFGSASPSSPNYVSGEIGQGGTANDQALVDWLYTDYDYESLDTDYWSIEGLVSGPLFTLPAGDLMVAVGAQYRETKFKTSDSPADNEPSSVCPTEEPCGDDYNSSPYNPIDGGTSGESGVSAGFFEIDVPILDNLSLVAAGRYEDFSDLGVDAFVPKVSARYQPIETLALRASVGEGFLAPTVTQVTPDPTPACSELFSGTDPFTGQSTIGTLSCTSGNADLRPEKSDIWNVGLTWQPFGDMEVSLDYQQIKYDDRIVRLGTTDTLNKDFANFLTTNGLTPDAYDALDAAAARALRDEWYVTGMNPDISRDLVTEDVLRVVRIPGNVASMKVNVVDFRLNWGFDLGSDAYMVMNLANTFYTKYDYEDAFGETTNAIGNRNGDTDIVPPLPEYRMNLRLNWLYRSHNVGVVVKYTPAVNFDGTTGPTFGQPAYPTPNKIVSQTIVDVRYSYRFENLWGGGLGIAVGSNNVFDQDPQPLPVLGGMETRLQDPLGQSFYVELTYGHE